MPLKNWLKRTNAAARQRFYDHACGSGDHGPLHQGGSTDGYSICWASVVGKQMVVNLAFHTQQNFMKLEKIEEKKGEEMKRKRRDEYGGASPFLCSNQ